MNNKKYILSENEMPLKWYNVLPDLPVPLQPPLNPITHKPATPDELTKIFAEELIKQEVATESEIPIPEEILDIYKLWRPTPLVRALNFEKAIKTGCRIFFKNESLSPAGSHKLNTSSAQAYYNKKQGIKNLVTETGAGQWGSALALACEYFKLNCKVFMVKVSYEQKPFRKSLIKLWGAQIFSSPSNETEFGRKILKENPDSPGSLGIAISEAVEIAASNSETNYTLGSVLNHVLLHQTIIGLETKKQFEKFGFLPDAVIACVGGGSNFGGIALPFVRDKINGKKNIRLVAVEPLACPTLTKGDYRYDFGDTAGLTPLIYMYTLGHNFIPPAIHSGGLRYHGISPIISNLHKNNLIESVALHQNEVFDAGVLFSRTEGIIPAPESCHAICSAVRIAKEYDKKGESKNIVFCLSGHGHFDLSSFDKYFSKELEDYEYPESEVKKSLKDLPDIKI